MSENLDITLPNGEVKHYPKGVTGFEIAQQISEGLARNALAVKVNGEVVETSRPIYTDAEVQILTWRDEDGNIIEE